MFARDDVIVTWNLIVSASQILSLVFTVYFKPLSFKMNLALQQE